ncbi:uncharacterized protein PG998_005362 [Apiospora kogelbergensis]|uniref:uncharacterized protein n=1 Tax=Apiospora kogelbergensis TaxID=1337665 RepID=UPI00312ED86C
MVQVSFNIGAAVENASITASWSFNIGWSVPSSTKEGKLTSTTASAAIATTTSFPVNGSTTPSAALTADAAAITSSPLEHILAPLLLPPNAMPGHDLTALPPTVGGFIMQLIGTTLFCCGLGLLAVGSVMIVGAAFMGIVYGLVVSVLYVRRWLQMWWRRQRRTEVLVLKEVPGKGQQTVEGKAYDDLEDKEITDGSEDTPPSLSSSSSSSSVIL